MRNYLAVAGFVVIFPLIALVGGLGAAPPALARCGVSASGKVVVGHHVKILRNGVTEDDKGAGACTDAWRPTSETDKRGSIRVAKSPGRELEEFNPFVPHVEGAISVAMIHGSVDRVKQLIAGGLDVNKKYRYGRTPLMQAAAFCGSEIARILLDNGAKINATDDDGMTALMLAVPRCEPEMVRILIGRGAEVNARAKDGSTALMWAVCLVRTPMIRPVASEKEMVQRSHEWWRRIVIIRLTKTRRPENLDLTNRLIHPDLRLSGNIDPFAEREAYEAHVRATVLRERRYYEQRLRRDAQRAEKVLAILIEAGAEVNAKNDQGSTALMQATCRERLVRILLQKGAEVDAADGHGQTALMIASQGGCVESAKALIENGADVNAKDDKGRSVLVKTGESPFLREDHGVIDDEKQENRAKIAELILAKGADINARSKDGETALNIAQKNGWHAMVKVLKAHGAKE